MAALETIGTIGTVLAETAAALMIGNAAPAMIGIGIDVGSPALTAIGIMGSLALKAIGITGILAPTAIDITESLALTEIDIIVNLALKAIDMKANLDPIGTRKGRFPSRVGIRRGRSPDSNPRERASGIPTLRTLPMLQVHFPPGSLIWQQAPRQPRAALKVLQVRKGPQPSPLLHWNGVMLDSVGWWRQRRVNGCVQGASGGISGRGQPCAFSASSQSLQRSTHRQ